jgi:hypothetical protein
VNGSQAIICPTCEARIPLAEVPDHEHFQVVPS